MEEKIPGLKEMLAEYIIVAGSTLNETPFDKIVTVASILMQTREKGSAMFACGNGGSSATASHFVNDFVKGLSVEGKKRFKMFSLNDSVPTLTALSNDYDYSLCFVEQLKNYAKAEDVFIAFTGSGNSPNVVKGAQYARQIGMKVIAFTGRDGGNISEFCDVNCIAATDIMEVIEDMHMVWIHALVCGLRQIIISE